MDKDQIVVNYLQIYFNCYPEELPKDPDKALVKMQELHKKYKDIIIDGLKTKSDKFVDKFMDDKKDVYY